MVAGNRRSGIRAVALSALLVTVAAACADGNSAAPFLPTTSRPTGAAQHANPVPKPPKRPARKPVPVGAAPLGTTAYPIPSSGAYFVSTSGDDNAAGTRTAPWRTLAHAVAAVPFGATIVMRAGVYNESVIVDGKRLTIQPYPHESVTLRGSQPVTDWSPQGSVWRARWTYRFPHQRGDMLQPQYPMANAPDEVFVDGVEMQQVGSLGEVGPTSFYVDKSSRSLYVGVDPGAHEIDASYLSIAISLMNADGSIVRGIAIDRYATPLNSYAPLQVLSDGVQVENVISQYNSAAGITVQGSGVTLQHDTFAANGQLGAHAYRADGLVIDNTLLRRNNVEHFDPADEAGGVKISSTTGVTVRSTEADHNYGDGIWFDVADAGATIVRNVVHANQGEGIQYEISSNAVVASNVVYANDGAGIRITESTGVDVWNNTLARNRRDLEVLDGDRPQTVQDVRIRNNVFFDGDSSADVLLAVDDLTHRRTAAEMDVTADGDSFCRPVPSVPLVVAIWAALPVADKYTAVASFSQSTGQETHGHACDGVAAGRVFVNVEKGDYRLVKGSPVHGAGMALPPNVATAIGVKAGIAVDAGALRFG